MTRNTFEAKGDCRTAQCQGEPVAWLDPSCGLTWLANRMDFAPGTKFYTHADPVEVERLRDENASMLAAEADLMARRDFWGRKFKEMEKERDTLRAQLAEAHTLLQKRGTLLGLARRALKGWAKSGPVIDQIDSALSASAEPKPEE